MKQNKLQELLIDYAEGTLDPVQKQHVENILRDSSDAQRDYDAIRCAFAELQKVENDQVPNFYFENFVPRLNETISKKKEKSLFILPAWIYKAALPFAAVMITISIFGLYNILNPAQQENLADLNLKDIDQSKLGEIIFFKDAINLPQLSSTEIDQDLIAEHIVPTSGLYENAISDRQILSQLDDSQIEYIVDHLNSIQ
jgi:hypothetical protein